MFSHLKSRTVLTGIAVLFLGAYQEAQAEGWLESLKLDPHIMAALVAVGGLCTIYFRVFLSAGVGADGKVTQASLDKIKADVKNELLKELSADASTAVAATQVVAEKIESTKAVDAAVANATDKS